MTPRTKYNGWTNYQTWNVVLWFDNDEGLYHAALAQSEQGRYKFNRNTAENFVRSLLPTGTRDLQGRAYGGRDAYKGVNWQEISRSFNEK